MFGLFRKKSREERAADALMSSQLAVRKSACPPFGFFLVVNARNLRDMSLNSSHVVTVMEPSLNDDDDAANAVIVTTTATIGVVETIDEVLDALAKNGVRMIRVRRNSNGSRYYMNPMNIVAVVPNYKRDDRLGCCIKTHGYFVFSDDSVADVTKQLNKTIQGENFYEKNQRRG